MKLKVFLPSFRSQYAKILPVDAQKPCTLAQEEHERIRLGPGRSEISQRRALGDCQRSIFCVLAPGICVNCLQSTATFDASPDQSTFSSQHATWRIGKLEEPTTKPHDSSAFSRQQSGVGAFTPSNIVFHSSSARWSVPIIRACFRLFSSPRTHFIGMKG